MTCTRSRRRSVDGRGRARRAGATGCTPPATTRWHVLADRLGGCLVQLVERLSPSAVIAAGSERGNEVMAHVGAILDQPMAANCTQATRRLAGHP